MDNRQLSELIGLIYDVAHDVAGWPRLLELLSEQMEAILPDNRLLGYAQYGISDGLPLVLMHAIIGSRLQRHPDETIVERMGIRLIIPERPGVGLSDNTEHMTLLGLFRLKWRDDWQKRCRIVARIGFRGPVICYFTRVGKRYSEALPNLLLLWQLLGDG